MESQVFETWQQWQAPALDQAWKLGQHKVSKAYLLVGGTTQVMLTPVEFRVLRHFNGQETLGAIAQRHSPNDPLLLPRLLQKLIDHQVLSLGPPNREPAPETPQLKPGVEWRHNPDGHWIIRNPIHKTYIQASTAHKTVFEQLGQRPLPELLLSAGLSKVEFQGFYRQLAAAGMLVGIEPPQRPPGKFNPLQLLFFKTPLFNPDRSLERLAPALGWLWSRAFGYLLLGFLSVSVVGGWSARMDILDQGQAIMAVYGSSLWMPFALVAIAVVTLHELGHALTLKHYRGTVPEVGLLWMCLIPAAYTDTTDSYCLGRRQRVGVVAAGLVVQIAIAALGFWLWHIAAPETWLNTASLMVMAAALVTVALNLNPLARFDGYYFLVAATGINNLRSRAFLLYKSWLTGQPNPENRRDTVILAMYAPFSLLYVWLIFGLLFWHLTEWTLLNAPVTVFVLFLLWLIYYLWPSPPSAQT